GDFLENNAELVPSGYVEEFWAQELKEKVTKYEPNDTEILRYINQIPSIEDAFRISLNFGIGLHPHYLYYWDQITTEELETIISPSKIEPDLLVYPKDTKEILEKLGVPHEVAGDTLVLKDTEAKVFFYLLFRKPMQLHKNLTIPEIISQSSGIKIRNKFSTAIGVRVGRPEKS